MTAPPKTRGGNPILRLANMNHYSDPALSQITYHEGNAIKEVMPLAGVNIMQQQDPLLAMEFVLDAFNGLGGYGFPATNRFMIYDADPTPFQVERTIGIVFASVSAFGNNQIFGFSKHNSFNTHWRVGSHTSNGGSISFGRQETDLGEFPILVPAGGNLGRQHILIFRQVSLERHEFYFNSYTDPIIINPQDNYFTSNRVRIVLGRTFSGRSETGVVIGPIFDAYDFATDKQIERIAKYLSVRTGIALNN